jgi:hypothetical protein
MSSYTGVNDIDELVLFIQEKVQEYDPSIDTTSGSAFYNSIIKPLIDRIGPDPYETPLRDFITRRLKTEFPDLVLQDGEPIDDYAVKIMTILLEPFRRQIRQVSNNQSLANADILNEREADNLGANFFVRRRQGAYAVGLARLYFTAPRNSTITPNNLVYDAGGHRYIPVENQSITADNMLFNLEDNLYYQDVIVRAEQQGDDFNIDINTLTGIENAPEVIKVTNKASFEEGANKETTTEFIERVENSLTEKSLVTFRGINARLTDVFESIRLIQTIGFGDVEMERDIIKGSGESAPYAYFLGAGADGTYYVDLDIGSPYALMTAGGDIYNSFITAGVKVGDTVILSDLLTTGSLQVLTVAEIISASQIRVSEQIVGNIDGQFALRRAEEIITLSDIPGGILQPTTQQGEIQFTSGEAHIGGMLDVYVRAGQPTQKEITLEGIRDGEPLHFGVDLETFGGEDDKFIYITEALGDVLMRTGMDRFGVALATNNEVLVKQYLPSPGGGSDPGADSDTVPWKFTSDDVGRYIQILTTGRQATLEILEVMDEEYTTAHSGPAERCVRLKVKLTNEESGSAYNLNINLSFDTNIRVVEKTTSKPLVRDRDASRTNSWGLKTGCDFTDLEDTGVAEIGDSVVIETGEDAGIYTIRRILDSLNNDDTLLLDRNLTKNATPSGTGDGSGLRYRLDDELNVDLVAPKVVKIPLGTIFLGLDLNTVAGSTTASSGGVTNFLLAGVASGDTLEILEGDNKGKYGISLVTGTELTLDSAPLNTGFSQKFSIYRAFTGIERPLVRVKDVELLDSNSQPTGIIIPYGDYIDIRALGLFSNRAEGVQVESYRGVTQTGGLGDYYLQDDDVDFTAEGVVAGYRLNVINTNNAGTYTVAAVPSAHVLQVAVQADGGTPFVSLTTGVHYTIGLPSSGFVRLYFLNPTSVEIPTGLNGARMVFDEAGTPRRFRFSQVDGFTLLPSPGSTDTELRDIRVTRTLEPVGGSGDFQSIVELTSDDHPDVFGLELVEGDILEMKEQLPFRTVTAMGATATWNGTTTVVLGSSTGVYVNRWIRLDSDGQFFRVIGLSGLNATIDNPDGLTIPTGVGASSICSTFEELGVFGKPAGLRTVSGSNRVEVPSNSLIDFQAMNRVYPLPGQTLKIESGPDAGEYVVETVESAKALRLSRVLTSTTQTIKGQDTTPRQSWANQRFYAGTGTTDLYDPADAGALGSTEGHWITIFESTRDDIDGAYEIQAYPSVGRVTLDWAPNNIEGTGFSDFDCFGIGRFSWLRTESDENIEQPFHIYASVATQVEVSEVGSVYKAPPGLDIVMSGTTSNPGAGNIRMTRTDGTGSLTGVVAGDRLEVLSGPNRGVYPIASVGATYVDIVNNTSNNFQVLVTGNPFRVRGGIHGARKMLTVSGFESSNGKLYPGTMSLYRLLRQKIFRISSTEMQENFDGSFYYADIQVESDGSGDEYNLERSSRLVLEDDGLVTIDGYTYTVDNSVKTFSPFEEVSLAFDRRFLPVGNSDSPENRSEVSGRNLKVKYETSVVTRLVHDLLRSDTDRPINANPLARHFLPSYVYVNFVYSGGASPDVLGPTLEDYINTLGAEAQLQVSDLEAFLTRRGADYVKHPVQLTAVTHDLDRNLVVDRTEDQLGGLNSVPYHGTGRISAFFARVGEGLSLDQQ